MSPPSRIRSAAPSAAAPATALATAPPTASAASTGAPNGAPNEPPTGQPSGAAGTPRSEPIAAPSPSPTAAPNPLALSDADTASRQASRSQPPEAAPPGPSRGFGGGGEAGGSKREAGASKRKGQRRRSPALSKADWGPLGKHPDLDAIVARQRLRLPLSGRLTPAQVNQAWKRCAGEHHPDRGGEHDTMQLVNGARDLLLGRDER
ncbi:MAG: hypothetical protein ACK52U_07275 [Synechococcaceae cyanobacterium]